MNNTKEKKNIKKCSMVALDSNIFIFMVRTKEGYVNHSTGKLRFFDALRVLKSMNANGHLKFVITPTVMYELYAKLDKRERQFLKEHCIVAIPKNERQFTQEVIELAKTYQTNDAMNGSSKYATADAMIMAEATILGLNLLTANEKDFIAYGLDEQASNKRKKGVHTRADNIKKINRREGYEWEYPNGKTICPTAYNVQSFLDLYRTEIFPIKFMKGVSYSYEK